jgi:hypothetical protein
MIEIGGIGNGIEIITETGRDMEMVVGIGDILYGENTVMTTGIQGKTITNIGG